MGLLQSYWLVSLGTEEVLASFFQNADINFIAGFLKVEIVIFKLVFINILGFDLLVWGIRAMFSQLSGDLLQFAFVGLQLFLLG